MYYNIPPIIPWSHHRPLSKSLRSIRCNTHSVTLYVTVFIFLPVGSHHCGCRGKGYLFPIKFRHTSASSIVLLPEAPGWGVTLDHSKAWHDWIKLPQLTVIGVILRLRRLDTSSLKCWSCSLSFEWQILFFVWLFYAVEHIRHRCDSCRSSSCNHKMGL